MARSGEFEVPHVPRVPRIRLRVPHVPRIRLIKFRNRASVFRNRASVFRADTQGIPQRISEDFCKIP